MQIVDCNLNSFLTDTNFVVLFGTGRMARDAAREPELINRIIYCVDNDARKHRGKLGAGDREIPVYSPAKLTSEDWENKVILIASSYFKDIEKQLNILLAATDVKVYIYPIARLNYANQEEFFRVRILEECTREYGEVLEQLGICGECLVKMLNDKHDFILGDSHDTRPFVVPRTMIMPTTRCNMRCEGCSSLLPLFEKPQDIDIHQTLRDLNIFFSAIDECIRLTIGGEPFLYPQLKPLLEYLIIQPKLLSILMITNSTILPDESIINLLRNEKVFLEVSDYGHLEKMSRLVVFFEKNGVNFKVLTNQKWDDMGDTLYRDRTADELRYTYLNCEQGRLIKGVHNGFFHTCARSARMLALGVYTSDNDYFSLSDEMPVESTRRLLKHMYYSEYADACNYCDLGAFPNRKIPAGIQMSGNIRKSKYTIIDRNELEELRFAAQN
ncbi:MAG: radical SAM protein [Prevotellaceae bacterium]|jgi:organic radical activating enzyme|nr:radical SAM protein [Prevotellaceae bacterium]